VHESDVIDYDNKRTHSQAEREYRHQALLQRAHKKAGKGQGASKAQLEEFELSPFLSNSQTGLRLYLSKQTDMRHEID
jgi:hypothetical protein